jgi:hypothetical protein
MDKAYPFKTPIVVGALEKETDTFSHTKREKRYWVLNTHT